MTKIQLKLDTEENQIVEIYKAVKGLNSKKQAIKEIIKEHKALMESYNDNKIKNFKKP